MSIKLNSQWSRPLAPHIEQARAGRILSSSYITRLAKQLPGLTVSGYKYVIKILHARASLAVISRSCSDNGGGEITYPT